MKCQVSSSQHPPTHTPHTPSPLLSSPRSYSSTYLASRYRGRIRSRQEAARAIGITDRRHTGVAVVFLDSANLGVIRITAELVFAANFVVARITLRVAGGHRVPALRDHRISRQRRRAPRLDGVNTVRWCRRGRRCRVWVGRL